MLGKLLKKDLNKNMRWMWILFVCAIAASAVTRGCHELGKNLAFFKILSIFFDTVFYSILANLVIQPFLRSFLNFTKSMYGDESYLTHTLPVTKNQILTSKFLTSVIETTLGFITIVIALLIRFATPTMITTLKLLLSMLIIGDFSVILVLALFTILVIVEFLMYISIILFSIVLAYKSKDKRVFKSFIFTAIMSFASLTVLAIVMIVVLTLSGVNLTSTTLVLSSSTFIKIVLTGIIVYTAITLLFHFLTRKELNKGVNVD